MLFKASSRTGPCIPGGDPEPAVASITVQAVTDQQVFAFVSGGWAALPDLLAGNIKAAIRELAGPSGQLWAALPGGVQPRVTLDHAVSVFVANGGVVH